MAILDHNNNIRLPCNSDFIKSVEELVCNKIFYGEENE